MALFKKVLVANRGEIAVRVIQACQEMGIGTVAIASQADRDSLHARFADEVYEVGPPKVSESYLNLDRIIEIAHKTGAEAIHPGYGMFAESAGAVRKIEEAGLTFIGPPADVIALMGDKVAARAAALEAGVPVVEGTPSLTDLEEAVSILQRLGFPLMLKPAGGGGGIGITIVNEAEALEKALQAAQRLGQASFGSASVYAERYLAQARHIEIQIAADAYGHVIHLGERECTIQRRYQKLLEETPSYPLDDDLRRRIAEAAVRLAATIGYRNLGTMEFLLAPNGEFFFSEMNTRLQVEHPVTEQVTGVDMVRMQIAIAAGEPLRVRQDEIRPRGHAIECRIYSEDFRRNFLPSMGEITAYEPPTGPGVRVDSGVRVGSRVTMYYDPLLCKVTVWDQDRPHAIARMRRALQQFTIEGVKTTRELHLLILDAPEFHQARLHTRLLEEMWVPRFQEQESTPSGA